MGEDTSVGSGALSASDERRRALEDEARRRALADPEATVEELRIHQIELELQHEQLQAVHEELAQANGRLRLLFEKAPVGYLVIDGGLVVRRVNERARALFGDLANKPVSDLAASGEAPALRTLALGRAARGPPQQLRLQGSRGALTARVSARPDGEGNTLLVVEDITEAAAVSAALAASETRLRTLIDSAGDAIAVVRDDVILFANAYLCRLMGYSRTELIGQHFGDLCQERAGEGVPGSTLTEVVLRGRLPHASTFECRELDVAFEGAPATFFLMRDVTDRDHLKAQLARRDRLAATGLLVAGIAHELNNPLAFLLANIQMVRDRLPELPSRKDSATSVDEMIDMLRDAYDGGARLAAIVRDLKTFQQSDGVLTAVTVNDVIAQTMRIAGPKIAYRVTLERDLGLCQPAIGNEGHISQVVLNLVLNAAEAMPERPPAQNLVSVRTWQRDDEICISVHDNGLGLSDDEQSKIFDPFYTSRRGEGGTGLGLAVSSSLVEQMGGFISVTSEPEHGSTFVVHLRRHGSSPGRGASGAPAASGPSRATPDKLRVLIIDDEPVVGRALKRIVKQLGAPVVATSGNEAIRILAQDQAFDVILCDLVMPDGSGYDVDDWLKANHPELRPRLAFMSGMRHPVSDRKDATVELRKPFELDEVIALIRAAASRTDRP